MDYEEIYDKLFRYCYFKLQHRQDAEDITQEAILRYLKSDVDVSDRKGLPYLYTIARNLCIDKFRKIRTEELSEYIPAPDDFEGLHEKIQLEQAVSGLPEEEQELIFLRYVNAVPVSAICEITGMSRFAVYRKISAILKRLREEMKEEW